MPANLITLAHFSVSSAMNLPKSAEEPEIIEKLNKEINAGISDPNIKARLADLGGIVLAF